LILVAMGIAVLSMLPLRQADVQTGLGRPGGDATVTAGNAAGHSGKSGAAPQSRGAKSLPAASQGAKRDPVPPPMPPPMPQRDQLALAPMPALAADGVLVIKSERRLYLMRQGRAIRTYDVALGFNPVGHKQHEGDGRTPEGLYVLGSALPESRFYRALPISYPAPDDVERARAQGLRPGGRIMIHGLPPSGARMGRQHLYLDWTDGCVAVTNDEIDEIAEAVRPGTPIEIRP
jgi:lipoprotein-anchoring transpeptidase ErfK/SrfK